MPTELPPAPRVTHPETKPATEVEVVDTPSQIAAFQKVPGYVYWHDPHHVWPLLAAERRFLDPKANPFFSHAEARLFVIRHGHGKPVGRIAATIDRDYEAKHGAPTGFFGYFDFLGDARLPETLLAAAVNWLREKGASEIYGPCSLTLNHPGAGMLVDGFDEDPYVDTAYNPPHYHAFVSKLPLVKWRDLHGYEVEVKPPTERIASLAKAAREREGFSVRPFDLGRLEEELDLIRGLYNEAWQANTGAVPLRLEEMRFLFEALRPALDPGLLLVLEHREAPIGFSLTLPDWNRVLRHLDGSLYPFGWLKAAMLRRTIDRVRVVLFGVVEALAKHGAATTLLEATWRAIHERGFVRADISWIMEDNERAANLVEGLGGRRTRTWRVFRVPPDAF